MDPNEALRALREAVEGARQDIESQGYVNLPDVQTVLAQFWALDMWLTKGGFLPEAWGERGKCAKRLTEVGTRPYTLVCTKPPGHGGPHEDEKHGRKWTHLETGPDGLLHAANREEP